MRIRVKFRECVNYNVPIEIPPEGLAAFQLDPYGWLEDHFFELLETQKSDWYKSGNVREREVIEYKKEKDE